MIKVTAQTGIQASIANMSTKFKMFTIASYNTFLCIQT